MPELDVVCDECGRRLVVIRGYLVVPCEVCMESQRDDGYSMGVEENSSDAYETGFQDGEGEGYDNGYRDGYQSGVESASNPFNDLVRRKLQQTNK